MPPNPPGPKPPNPKPDLDAAEVILGLRIARFAGMIETVEEGLAKLAADLDSFAAGARAIAPRPPAGEAVGAQSFGYGWNELGRDVSALLRATVAIANATAGPQPATPNGAGLTWADSARPEKPAPTKPPHWLWDTLAKLGERARETVGRVGRKVLGKKGYSVVTKGAGVMRSAFSAGRAAAAGRGALGGVLAGGRAGAIVGGAGGPAGMVVGAVAGVLAAGAKSVFDTASGLFTTLTGSIVRILNPVAVLSRAIGSSTSGYSVLGKSVDYLASVIGVMLAPLFLSLSAAVLTVADAIRGPMLEAARAIGPAIKDFVLEALVLFVTALEVAIDVVRAVSGHLMDMARVTAAVVGGLSGGLISGRAVANVATAGISERYLENRKKFGLDGDNSKDGKDTANGWRAKFDKNYKLSEQEYARSMMPRAQVSELGDLNRNATMAGLNMTPFEQKTLEWQQEVLFGIREGKKMMEEKPRQ